MYITVSMKQGQRFILFAIIILIPPFQVPRNNATSLGIYFALIVLIFFFTVILGHSGK